jgi:hypothetical protein
MRENDGKVNLIMIYSKHICKCHEVFPLYNYYMLMKKKKISDPIIISGHLNLKRELYRRAISRMFVIILLWGDEEKGSKCYPC